jgi:hypothetical protein
MGGPKDFNCTTSPGSKVVGPLLISLIDSSPLFRNIALQAAGMRGELNLSRRSTPAALALVSSHVGVVTAEIFLPRSFSHEHAYGHSTAGGSDDKIAATLPPVFRPKIVPRS